MRKYYLGAIAAVPLALIMGACNSNSGTSASPTTSAPKAAPTTAPPTTAPPTTAAPATSAPAPAASSATVPIYQPSTVISQATGHTQLSSPDDVAKVTAFYQNALGQGGWSITSNAKTTTSANFVAKRTGQGTTVAISTTGPSGTSISISTYAG
jgi:hypothetical protein